MDYSTTVFVVTATYTVVNMGYYKQVKLVSGNTSLGLYCSGDGQYSWLKDYEGQELVFEVAACNWNDKGYWVGCVLAVRTEDGKVYNQLNYLS